MSNASLPGQSGHRSVRLNPFIFPSDTDFRFALLILAVLGASIFIFSTLYLTIPVNFVRTDVATQSSQAVFAAHPTQSNADIQARLNAINQYVVPSDRTLALWVIGCLCLQLSLALAVYWILPTWKIRRHRLVPLSAAVGGQDGEALKAYLVILCQEVGLSYLPEFVCNPANWSRSGVAFGRFGHYYVQLNGGLLLLFKTNPSTFRAIVLHELSHLRNADVNKTYFTLSLWWIFVVTTLLPAVLYLLYSFVQEAELFFLSPASFFKLHLNHFWLSFLWPLLMLALLVYMTRNALIHARELYADSRAGLWIKSEELDDALGLFNQKRQWPWLSLLRLHPDQQQRRLLLQDPSSLFHMRFVGAFATGLTVMIALPNIVNLLYWLHIGGAGITAQFVGFLGTGLLLAPFVAGVLNLGIWRATVLRLARGTLLRTNITLSLGLTLGILLGQLLSLIGIFPAFYSQNTASYIIFDILWGLLLLFSLLVVTQWVKDCISAWLESAAASASPLPTFWIGFVVTGLVLAVLFSSLYWLFYTTQGTSFTLDIAGVSALLQSIITGDGLVLLYNPFVLLSLIFLWLYPLSAAFLRKRTTQDIRMRWALVEPDQQLLLPPQPPFRLLFALSVAAIGALLCCFLLAGMRIFYHFTFSEAVRQTESFYTITGWIRVALTCLFQGAIAAVVVARVHRAAGPHGLFAAFIGGCLITIGIVALALLLFPVPIPSLADLWQATLDTFVLTVEGGALFAFLIASGSSMLAHRSRLQQAVSVSSETISLPPSVNSRPINRQSRPTVGLGLLFGLVVLLMLSSGIAGTSYAVKYNQLAVSTIRAKVTSTAVVLPPPYPPYHGTLVLNDPLSDNTHGNQWKENSGCKFTEGAYNVSVTPKSIIQPCLAAHTNFSNFIYEVSMQFKQESLGGIIFRTRLDNGTLFAFFIAPDGSYELYRFDSENASPKELISGSSPAIVLGVNHSNLVAVVANRGIIYLYVNHQKITTINDSTLTTGSIGVVALVLNTPAEIVFSDAKVWIL